jgi:CDP-diacylglycerol--glycerol-3-phosphate 3-phosphatidyltransferase
MTVVSVISAVDYFWGFWRKIDHASEKARIGRKRTSVLTRNVKPAKL